MLVSKKQSYNQRKTDLDITHIIETSKNILIKCNIKMKRKFKKTK